MLVWVSLLLNTELILPSFYFSKKDDHAYTTIVSIHGSENLVEIKARAKVKPEAYD